VPDLLDDLRRYGDAVETAALDRDRPAYVADDEPEMLPAGRSPSRRRVLVGVAAVALVALVVSLTVLLGDDDHDSVRIDTPPTSITPPVTALPITEPLPLVPASEVPASAAQWRRLDPGPLGLRTAPSTVWTGSEMIIWGGGGEPASVAQTPYPTFDDGAAYEPATDRWSSLPPAPIPGRALHIGVWTGSEMIIWGGGGDGTDFHPKNDGAAYEPTSREWRTITPSPLPTGPTYAGAWTGQEMVVVGTGDGDVHAASYDPESDSWDLLDTTGLRLEADLPTLDVLWTGSRIVAVTTLPLGPGPTALIFDPSTEQWSTTKPPDYGARAIATATLGGVVYLVSFHQWPEGTIALDPATGTWGPHVQLDLSCEGGHQIAPVASRLFVTACGRSGFYDPAAASWQPVASAIGGTANTVRWTGGQLLWLGIDFEALENGGPGAAGLWSLTP
jgi:hypothetical protein